MNFLINLSETTPLHNFFKRNSFIGNLYWDSQIAKKLSTRATEVKKLDNFFVHLFIIILKIQELIFLKDVLRKESFCGTNPYSEMETILKSVVICFQL